MSIGDWAAGHHTRTAMPGSWALLALAAILCLCLVAGLYGLWIVETLTSRALELFNPGVLPDGKQISGPKWQYPNGAVIERFINGRANSEKWQRYGPVYRVWSGTHPEIVITTPQDLRHFSSDANDHPKTPNVNLGWFVGELLGQAMGLQHGPDWKRLRRIFDPAFTHSAAVARLGPVGSAAREYVHAELPRLAGGEPGPGGGGGGAFSLPMLQAVTKFPYLLTAATIYGPMTAAEEHRLWAVTEERILLNRYWIGGGAYRFETAARLCDGRAVGKLREFNREWREYNAHMVRARRERGERPPIVTYWEEHEKGSMAMVELLQTLDELLMLNLDVITHVITWFITLVAQDARVEQELRDEVAANKDSLSEYLAKADTHLHRCFIESMRVRPFAVFTIGESSSVTKNFHGVVVKPNTQILVDVLAINVRNPFWGPSSACFDPARLKGVKQSDLRYNLHSFGIGSRKCMGQFVAGHIVKALIAHLFDRYEVSLQEPEADMSGKQGTGVPGMDKNSSWTPKAQSLMRLARREGAVL